MRIGVISDTHNRHKKMGDLSKFKLDMIIHCGDFQTSTKSCYDFINWFGELDIKYKILIAGNHDKEIYYNYNDVFQLINLYNIDYLQDKSITIEGIKFYGSPWVPTFGNYVFMKDDIFLYDVWQKIPIDTDILITHGPGYKELDMAYRGKCCGSITLSTRKKDLKSLKYHFFGHIHEDRGILEHNGIINVNASCFDFYDTSKDYEPFIFDVNI